MSNTTISKHHNNSASIPQRRKCSLQFHVVPVFQCVLWLLQVVIMMQIPTAKSFHLLEIGNSNHRRRHPITTTTDHWGLLSRFSKTQFPTHRLILLWGQTPHSSSDNSSTSSASSLRQLLKEKLKLNNQFDRWKFLQELLDDFVPDDDVHQLLYIMLQQGSQRNLNDNDDSPTITTITPEQRIILHQVLQDHAQSQSVPAFADTTAGVLQQLESLLPDPLEDEDGFKSSWDTVLELYGREAVRINEESKHDAVRMRWKALSIVARVLIHYDFLSEGILVVRVAEQDNKKD